MVELKAYVDAYVELNNSRCPGYVAAVVAYVRTLQPKQVISINGIKREHYENPEHLRKTMKESGIRLASSPQINVDWEYLKTKLIEVGIVNRKMKAISKNNLILAEPFVIVSYFTSVAYRLLSFYSCCNNFNKIKDLVDFQIRYSVARTLANKMKYNSVKKAFTILGKDLSISSAAGIISFPSSKEIRSKVKGFKGSLANP